MDVDGKGHVSSTSYRRIVRDHPEELRRAGLGEPARRRRSGAAPAGACAPRLEAARSSAGGAPRRRAPDGGAGASARSAVLLDDRLWPRAPRPRRAAVTGTASTLEGEVARVARAPAGRRGGRRRGGCETAARAARTWHRRVQAGAMAATRARATRACSCGSSTRMAPRPSTRTRPTRSARCARALGSRRRNSCARSARSRCSAKCS